jgi:hypothetical protein
MDKSQGIPFITKGCDPKKFKKEFSKEVKLLLSADN